MWKVGDTILADYYVLINETYMNEYRHIPIDFLPSHVLQLL
jgi:hypothetical protein